MATPIESWIGKRFNRLTILAFSHLDKWKARHYICKCECGKEKTISLKVMKRAETVSCGCHRKEASAKAHFQKHGHAKRKKTSKTFATWTSIIQRTQNPKSSSFKRYGGRGIKICKRWADSFENFLEDMGEASFGMSIDRKNNEWQYSKENCRWATRIQQQNNMRSNTRIKHAGEILSMADWARRFGVNYQTFCGRIKRGWKISDMGMESGTALHRGEGKNDQTI